MNEASKKSALRTARGVLFAASSATLAVTAHSVAEGDLPNIALTVLLAVLVGWLSTALAGKVSGLFGAVVILGFAQLSMHLILSELAGHVTHPTGEHGGVAMFITHSVATVLTALLLAFSESMLSTAVAALRLILPIAWQPLLVPELPTPTLLKTPLRVRTLSVLLTRVHGRRGPPLFS